MVKSKKVVMGIVSLAAVFTLSACASGNNEETSSEESVNLNSSSEESMDMDSHSDMNHSNSDEVPEGLKVAENPTYEVGSQVMIETGHMEGMQGAQATIVGAYDTIAYAISYTPKTGGERVENHKWVIHEEIIDAGEEKLEPGAEVTINAEHMTGMDSVTAEIDSAEATTIYMIDFTPTTDGEKVRNHKWVTESELSPAE